MPILLADSFFASFFGGPSEHHFFLKVTPQGSPKGPQNPPKWSSKACPRESQSAAPILTTFFHIFHSFSNMAMCCKHSKYHIETTSFPCTRVQRKSKKKHSKNTSNSLQKPLKNQSQTQFKQRPRKSAPKSASKCDKVPKMCQNGVPNGGLSKSLFRHF